MKKLLATLLAIALVFSGVSLGGMVSKASDEAVHGGEFGIIPNNPAGSLRCDDASSDFMNLVTPAIADYAGAASINTVTEEYVADGWVMFEGGMTKEILLGNSNYIKMVANNVLQFNYKKLSEGWPAGSSVTFRKGAPFYYKNTSGALAYYTLNADYKITVNPNSGTEGKTYHTVKVEKIAYTGEYGIIPNDPAGNFNCSGTTDIINLVTPAISDYAGTAPTSTVNADYIANGWVTFSGGMTEEKLLEKMNFIQMVTNSVLQFNYKKLTEGWPEGSSVTFKKGAPFYYMSTTGLLSYKVLNADYRITALPGTAIAGTKYHNVKVEKIIPAGEFSINTGNPAGSLRCDNASIDFMNLVTSTVSDYAGSANTITSSYIEDGWVAFAEGMTKEILLNKVNSIGFAANNVIQFSYQKLTEGWPEGSYIILKKGAPFYYKNTAGLTAYVTLDAYYLITVIPKSGTAGKTYHTVKVTKSDTAPATPHICFENEHYDSAEAGCTFEGNIEYWICRCGKFYSDAACTQEISADDIVVPPSAHNTVHHEAITPGCHYDGQQEYWYCTDCEGFWLDAACTRVTNSKSVVLPATGSENLQHVEAVEPTCTSEGNIEHWYCPDCEQFWTDAACTQLTNSKNVIIGALAHDTVHREAIEPDCHYEGQVEHWFCADCEGFWLDAECKQVTNSKSVILPRTGSDNVVHFEAKEPACHYEGNIEYWYCPDCVQFWQDAACTQLTNSKNVILPATGSDNVVHFEAKESACHYEGNIEYWYCPDCVQFWTDEACTQLTNSKNVVLPATGSDNVTHVEAKAPTCTENGNVEYWHCPDCEKFWTNEACTQLTNSKSVILPAAGHKEVKVPAVAATCTKTGLTAGTKCSVCGEILDGCQVIKKVAMPKATKIKKAIGGKKNITVKFKKVKGINGYEIRIATKKNMKKGLKTYKVGASKTKKVIKKLKAGKNYWVQIRTYKIAGGEKTYAAWSKKVKVKTKK